jgi:hypothetical protein
MGRVAQMVAPLPSKSDTLQTPEPPKKNIYIYIHISMYSLFPVRILTVE